MMVTCVQSNFQVIPISGSSCSCDKILVFFMQIIVLNSVTKLVCKIALIRKLNLKVIKLFICMLFMTSSFCEVCKEGRRKF